MNLSWLTGTIWWRSMPNTNNNGLPCDSAKAARHNSTGSAAALTSSQRLLKGVASGFQNSPRFLQCLLLQCLNTGVQPTLVTRRFIFVHQAFSGHAVEHGDCSCISRRRGLFVTRTNCRHNTLNMGTHHRTHTGVAGSSCFCLTSTLFCLRGIRQLFLLEKLKIQPHSIVRAPSLVNQNSDHPHLDVTPPAENFAGAVG